MNQISKNAKTILSFAAILTLFGCLPPQAPTEPPKLVVPNFTFTPPTSAASKKGMTVAIIKPLAKGTMFSFDAINNYGNVTQAKVHINNMLQAIKVDLEKALVTKGYHTLGPFDSIDEMTFSQKESANLILEPVFDVSLDQVGGSIYQGLSYATQKGNLSMHGSVSLVMLEPLTREKVWIKRFDLETYTTPYQTNVLEPRQETYQGANGQTKIDLNNIIFNGIKPKTEDTQASATVTILNHFYQMAMNKMWDHLDPREIDGLKADADKLKKRKQF